MLGRRFKIASAEMMIAATANQVKWLGGTDRGAKNGVMATCIALAVSATGMQ